MLVPNRSVVAARGVALVIAWCAVTLDATPASACGGASCFTGWFLPADGTSVPANVTALAWMPPNDYSAPQPFTTPDLHFSRIDGASPEPVDFELDAADSRPTWIRLSSALTAGARYRLEVDGTCATAAVEFEATKEAPLPDTLGTVTATSPAPGEIQVATISGSCDTPLPAVISDVDLDLSDDAAPWSALFLYQTKVDGAEWAPSWSLAPEPKDNVADPRTKVFAECLDRPLASGQPIDEHAEHDGLSEGKHAIEIEAQLPGLDRVLRTQEKQIELSCEEPAPDKPSQSDPAKNEPAKNEPAQNEPAQNEPAQNGPAKSEPAQNEPAQNEPTKNEPAQNEPTKNEPAQNAASGDGCAVVHLGSSHAHGVFYFMGLLGVSALLRRRPVKHRGRWRAARD
jgi:hypothetical protein